MKPDQTPPLSPANASSPIPARKRRILVVDDARDAGLILGKLLERLGNEVTVQQNPLAALELAVALRPDLVLSDISMPQIDGFEFARRLRSNPQFANVPLVALTGYDEEEDRRASREAGFNFHLVKPISLEALQSLIASVPVPTAEESSGG